MLSVYSAADFPLAFIPLFFKKHSLDNCNNSTYLLPLARLDTVVAMSSLYSCIHVLNYYKIYGLKSLRYQLVLKASFDKSLFSSKIPCNFILIFLCLCLKSA